MAKKDVKITFVVTPRLFQRLESYAEKMEKTKSEVLRDLIETLPEPELTSKKGKQDD
jgi:predicted DNA-binding protein